MLLSILDKLNQKQIVLASASENRKMIIEKSGLKFSVSASTFEEDLPKEKFATSKDYVIKTSEMKILHKIDEFKKNKQKVDIIISADTIISIDDQKVVEKPLDKEHAFQILRELSDKGVHEVYTSVWIAFLNNETMEITKLENVVDCTKVYFEKLDDQTIWSYIESGEPFGKAGGYGIQSQAATFISKIEGDFYSVWGFPLCLFFFIAMASRFKSFFKKITDHVQTVKLDDVQQEAKTQLSKVDALKTKLIGKQPQKKGAKNLLNIDGFFYLTERIIMMPFPDEELIYPISEYLNEHHANQYIVYNLSEHQYDNSYFNNSVNIRQFSDTFAIGLPSPPLDAIFMICCSMQSWLQTDPKNIVILHCQGTKGRSSLIASCFLSYFYYKEFDGPKDTFQFYCQIANLNQNSILYPSQQRYLNYFGEVLNGFIPLNKPLILQRIIMYGIPDFSSEGEDNNEELKSDDENLANNNQEKEKILCAPYIQIFKNAQMIYSSIQTKYIYIFSDFCNRKLPDKFYYNDQCAIFDIGLRVENDFLVRCRHFQNSQTRISMFRSTVHTSFVVDNVIRLQKQELDGACSNEKYPKDFFLDMIFTDAKTNSNYHLIHVKHNNAEKREPEEENQGPIIVNKTLHPEEESKVDTIFDEEKRLMSGTKNVENKDDFWISIWSQLQKRNTDQKEATRKESPKIKLENQYIQQETSQKEIFQIGRVSNMSLQSQERISLEISSSASSNSKDDNTGKDSAKIPFNLADENHEEVSQLQKQLTIEEKERISKMIDVDHNQDEVDADLDNYLDNLENESD